MASTGTIAQVIGSTFDAQFPESDLPEIYNAVNVEFQTGGENQKLVGEVAKHLGGGLVRCIALASTDGVRRGDPCTDTGDSVTVSLTLSGGGSDEDAVGARSCVVTACCPSQSRFGVAALATISPASPPPIPTPSIIAKITGP